MRTEMKVVTESLMIADVMNACRKASNRGTSEETISEHLLLAAVTRLFLTVDEEGTEALLQSALDDVKSGDFARMLEEAGFIERNSMI